MEHSLSVGYFNCRGNTGGCIPPSRFSIFQSRFGRLSVENWALDAHTNKSQPARINPKFLPNMGPSCSEDLFFFWSSPNFKEKHFNFRQRSFFWSSLNLGDGITLISLKYFRMPNAFRKGCKSISPCKILQFTYCSSSISLGLDFGKYHSLELDIDELLRIY